MRAATSFCDNCQKSHLEARQFRQVAAAVVKHPLRIDFPSARYTLRASFDMYYSQARSLIDGTVLHVTTMSSKCNVHCFLAISIHLSVAEEPKQKFLLTAAAVDWLQNRIERLPNDSRGEHRGVFWHDAATCGSRPRSPILAPKFCCEEGRHHTRLSR